MQKTAAQHISRVTTPQKQQSFFGNKKDPAFFSPLIQPKLTIAPVNDPYEAEADAVADKVMRMLSTETLQAKPSPVNIQRKCEACEAEKELHRKEDESEGPELLQMKPVAGYTIQRQCAACEHEEQEIHRKEDDNNTQIRLKPANGNTIQRECAACEHEEEINRKETGPAAVPGVTPAVQQSLRSQGRPLDSGSKQFMESRFGYDFSDVQIHNDSLAHQSSKDIKARAYTHGKHIVFGEGQYQPETYEGKQLLAHELTHVVQQNGTLGRKALVQRMPGDEYGDYIASSGRKVPYDKSAERIEQLYRGSDDPYNRKRADFIAKCRQTGECDHIFTIAEVNRLYELSESKETEGLSLDNVIKLYNIRRLTFAGFAIGVVEDMFKFRAFQHKLIAAGYVILDDPLGRCIQGCHYLGEKKNNLLDCKQPSQAEIEAGEKEVYEIEGNAKFQPSAQLKAYINNTLKTKLSVPVKFRFGNLSYGVINIRKQSKNTFNSFNNYFNQAGTNGGFDDCFDAFDDIGPYCFGTQVMPFSHPELKSDNPNRTLALKVYINEGNITGVAGWLDGPVADFTDPKINSAWFHSFERDFYPIIFGEENAERQMSLSVFYNKLENGMLNIGLIGALNMDNQQNLVSSFVLNNENVWWKGLLMTNIAGTEQIALDISRTQQGYISGESKALHLDKSWTNKGFELEGSLDLSYHKGGLSLFGRASFNKVSAGDNPNRFSGEVSISLTDYPTAEKLFAQHALAKPVSGPEDLDNDLPDAKEKLGLTAWGKLHIHFVEEELQNKDKKGKRKNGCCSEMQADPVPKSTSLTGDASFLVHPDGYFITAGEVKLKKDYRIAKEFSDSTRLFKKPFEIGTVVIFEGAYINLKAYAAMYLCYHVGDAYFREINAKGYYSNHVKYPGEFSLAGTFDVPLHLGALIDARITATLRAGVPGFSVALVHAYIRAIGQFCLGTHLRATPAIAVTIVDGKPVYTFKGRLDINGLMNFALRIDAGLGLGKDDYDDEDAGKAGELYPDISLHKSKKDDDKDTGKDYAQTLFAKNWTLGNFSTGTELSYTLGSGAPIELDYKNAPDFNAPNFMDALWEGKKARPAGDVSGGFKDDAKKQVGKVQEDEFEPTHQEGDAIGKYALKENFTMNGTPHELYMIVGGTETKPEVNIKMHSDDPGELLEKIDEEIKEDKIILQDSSLNETVKEIKEEDKHELENIRSQTEHTIEQAEEFASDKKEGDIALKQIAKSMQTYGNEFEKPNLENDKDTKPTASPAAAPEPPAKKNLWPDLKKGDVIVELVTEIGYVVNVPEVRYKAERKGITEEYYGFKVHDTPIDRAFRYDTYNTVWTKRNVADIEPFTVDPRDPYVTRKAHIRVGQKNWDNGKPAGEFSDDIAARIGYDSKGNDWNQAGHLVAASLGGPGSFRSANIVPMTHNANHSYLTGMRRIEDAVWKDINAAYGVYDYTVEPIYDKKVQKPPVTIKVTSQRQFPNTTLPSNVPAVFEVDNKK